MLGICLTCYMTFRYGRLTGSYQSEKYFLSFSILYCGTFFLTMRAIFQFVRISECLKKLINTLGRCTFGVYLFHVLILQSKQAYNLYDFLVGNGMNRMLVSLIMCGVVAVVCYVIVYVLRLIPFIRSII